MVEQMDDQIEGTIKTLLEAKRCGFIRTEDGEDFFFHESCLQETSMPYNQLTVGQAVKFTPVPDAPRGPRAILVHEV